MDAKVSQLDKSQWTDGARRREVKFESWKSAAKARAEWYESPAGQAYVAAIKAHPLHDVLEGFGDESMRITKESGKWLFKSWDSGNGRREAFAMKRQVHPQATLMRAIRRDLVALGPPRGLGDREASVKNACQRAKQEVRRLCKVMAVNALWTLTYKVNVQDREVVLKHLDAFRRRVVALFGEWRYVATIERQERGAFHIHLATHALPVRLLQGGVRVKSWDVMRRIWRDVAGEFGGNFDESKAGAKRRGGRPRLRSCGSIASYIAGYVAKDMHEGELNRKRYSASRGVDVPECYTALFEADEGTMHSLVELCFCAMEGRVTRAWFDRERQVFYAESDDSVTASG